MFTARKTECPVTLQEFLAQAKGVEVIVNGQKVLAQVKEFSTGSFGWFLGDKISLKVGDKVVKVQMGLTMTVIGSKEAPRSKEFTEISPDEAMAMLRANLAS